MGVWAAIIVAALAKSTLVWVVSLKDGAVDLEVVPGSPNITSKTSKILVLKSSTVYNLLLRDLDEVSRAHKIGSLKASNGREGPA